MLQIVYLSRRTHSLSEADLRALRDVSARNNEICGATGLLLYDGTRFIQALEGDEEVVRSTMDRILNDRRHGELDYVSIRTVAARQFGDWSMDYKLAPAGSCSRAFLDKVRGDVAAVREPALQAIFIGFAALSAADGELE